MSISLSSVLSANKLKTTAIILMLLDHFVVIFIPSSALIYMTLRIPGRIVAPVFCFLIAEGYYHTSNKIKYFLRLLIFALISHYPFILAFNYSFFQATSVIWALAMGLLALIVLKSGRVHIVLKLMIFAACCAAAYTANWNFVAVLWIAGFGLFRGNLKRQILVFCAIGVIFHLTPVCLRFILNNNVYLHWYQYSIFLAIPFFIMYNGKLGIKSKIIAWSFYIFYPVHLVILYFIYKLTPLAEILGKLFI